MTLAIWVLELVITAAALVAMTVGVLTLGRNTITQLRQELRVPESPTTRSWQLPPSSRSRASPAAAACAPRGSRSCRFSAAPNAEPGPAWSAPEVWA